MEYSRVNQIVSGKFRFWRKTERRRLSIITAEDSRRTIKQRRKKICALRKVAVVVPKSTIARIIDGYVIEVSFHRVYSARFILSWIDWLDE